MSRQHILREIRHATHSVVFYLVLHGLLLIVLGVLFVYQPYILLLLISLGFIVIGAGALFAAYRIRRFAKHLNSFFELFS